MSVTRRDFLKTSAAVGGMIGFGATGCGSAESSDAPRPLRILVLGGTGFIGPKVVEYALARGHTITLFNRGRTNTHLFPEVEKLKGDRDGDLVSLQGKEWDGVIDNSGYIPRHIRDSAELLRNQVGRYLFTSSVAAYASFEKPGIDVDHPGGTLADPTREDFSMVTYGPFKILGENTVKEIYGNRATVVRPGYVVGPGDTSDRWTYWPVRVDRGGEMIAPGTPEDPIQIIDVRDLAGWMVRLLENDTAGTFNGVGPQEPIPFGRMLEIAREVSGADTQFTWVEPEFLLEHELAFPVWGAPEVAKGAPHAPLPTRNNIHLVSNQRSVASGLTYTDVTATTRDTLAWWKTLPEERRANARAFVDPNREAEVLAAWHAHA